MLYLFNSGYRPLYTANVLNTLCFPKGYTNEYRYKHTGPARQVSPTLYSDLARLRSGEECVVIFIDRFGENGYVYHPLRFAKYLNYRDVNEYVHFTVQLDTLLYPRDLNAFNRSLIQTMAPLGLPVLTNGNPLETHDGNYVIQSASIFGNRDEYQIDGPAWNSAVENVSRARALSTNDEQSPVFLRVDIGESDKKTPVTPAIQDEVAVYRLTKNTNYDLVLTYRFPRQRIEQTSTGRLELKLGESLKSLSDTPISIDSHANSLTIPFMTKRYIEDTSGSMSISPVTEPGRPELLLARASFQYRLGESSSFWSQIVVALLLFSIVGTLIGTDLSHLQPLTIKGLMEATRPKLLLGIAQTGILFWLFRLIGQKIL
jgi:hypothetical protein